MMMVGGGRASWASWEARRSSDAELPLGSKSFYFTKFLEVN
jgi:hypothetical protein